MNLPGLMAKFSLEQTCINRWNSFQNDLNLTRITFVLEMAPKCYEKYSLLYPRPAFGPEGKKNQLQAH